MGVMFMSKCPIHVVSHPCPCNIGEEMAAPVYFKIKFVKTSCLHSSFELLKLIRYIKRQGL